MSHCILTKLEDVITHIFPNITLVKKVSRVRVCNLNTSYLIKYYFVSVSLLIPN